MEILPIKVAEASLNEIKTLIEAAYRQKVTGWDFNHLARRGKPAFTSKALEVSVILENREKALVASLIEDSLDGALAKVIEKKLGQLHTFEIIEGESEEHPGVILFYYIPHGEILPSPVSPEDQEKLYDPEKDGKWLFESDEEDE